MKQWLLILFLFGLFLPTAKAAQTSEIRVIDPWIREAPAAAQVLAAFMTISNESRQSVQLEAASSTDFSTVEIHRSMTHAGMAHMMKQSSLQIEGGKRRTQARRLSPHVDETEAISAGRHRSHHTTLF